MKKNLLTFLTIATCSTGMLCAATPATTTATAKTAAHHGYREVDTAGAKDLINTEKALVIIDARTPEFDDGTRIPGAVFLPYSSTNEEIATAVPSKEAVVLVYCTSAKCPASKYMADKLVQLGYKNIVKYTDGIEAWIAAGNKVEQKETTK